MIMKRRILKYCFKKKDPDVAKRYAKETSVRVGKIVFNNIIEKQ